MENNDIDKETIIQSSSDNESDHRRSKYSFNLDRNK